MDAFLPIYCNSAAHQNESNITSTICLQFKRTPLHWAMDKGNIEVIKSLVAAGAEMEPLDMVRFAPICGEGLDDDA